jgi:DNA-binding transcriptional LysR family regulator
MHRYDNRMELRQLELFVAVAEERSFTRAAARSHVVQSSVSVSIQSLERELGAQLFDRSTHKVELTDAGLALLEGARLTLAAAEAARDKVAAVQGQVRGTLRLGVMQSLTAFDLASELTRYRRRHPGVGLHVYPALGGSHQLAEATRRGELDAAFVMLPARATAGLTTIVLASEPLSLAGAAEQVPAGTSPLPLAELARLNFVDFPPGWGVRIVVDQAFAAAGLARQVDVEVADISTCLLLLHAGLGVALLPDSLDLGAGTPLVRREVTGLPPWEVMMVLPEGQTRRAATSAFVEQILAATGTTEAGIRRQSLFGQSTDDDFHSGTSLEAG